jgi:hypothetical protein
LARFFGEKRPERLARYRVYYFRREAKVREGKELGFALSIAGPLPADAG